MSCGCGRDPADSVGARFVGERVQVRCGWTERTIGTVTDADALGIIIETSETERLIPWTAITSVRMGRA